MNPNAPCRDLRFVFPARSCNCRIAILLKAVDPLFARNGSGAVFPVSIGGTRAKPEMKVDVKKALLRRD